MVAIKDSRTSSRSTHHQRLHASLVRHRLTGLRAERNNGSNEQCDEPDFSALRLAMEESGNVCLLFGLYLSTRIDLLPIDGCLELSRIPGTAAATSWSQAQQFVEQELGIGIDQEFLAVEPMPYATSLLLDRYFAMLKTGESVSVQVLRSEFRSFPDEQVDALSILRGCTIFQHWTDFAMREVIDDFARELRLRIDQLEAAATFEALAADADDGSWAPRILRKYCRPGVLVLEQRPSTNLSFIYDRRRNSEPNILLNRAFDASMEKVAPALCLSWLRFALHGRVFPMTFRLDDVALLEDGRVTFLGEIFASSRPDSDEALWRYLIAAAADDPDECCGILLSMMTNAGTSKRSSQSHQDALAAFRQSVTCFMSAPGKQDFCSGMAARILRQLQIAIELGYRPRPFLVCFYRGLFSVLSVVRELQPRGDPLLEGLEGVWMTNIFASADKVMRMDPLMDIGGKYLAAMMEFPVKLDAALSNALRRNDDAEQDWRATSENPPPYPVSIVIVLVAAFLLVRHGPVQLPSVWVDRVSFSICCLIGVQVLRLAARP
jgi:hypothetical protein